YAHRDRMDETSDLIRAVRDKRYKYIRNFFPERSRAQDVTYMNVGGTMKSMRRLHAAGKLKGPERQFFEPTKPVEELYDTKADPHEVMNVAADPAHAEILLRLRTECERWQEQIGDYGLVPEAVAIEEMRPGGEKDRTAPPDVAVAAAETGRCTVTLTSRTPGASITYGLAEEPPTTRLYIQPFTVKPGTKITALACRLGFRNSEWSRAEANEK
ncbi:MAG: chitobiase/beta-hexosaminidase C-terminal domain-containing protein, partial [Planctomycetota bacterium]